MALITGSLQTQVSKQNTKTPAATAQAVLGPKEPGCSHDHGHNHLPQTKARFSFTTALPPHYTAAPQDQKTGLPSMGMAAMPGSQEPSKTLSKPENIRAHESRNAQGFQEAYQAMSEDDRNRFDGLITRLTPEGTTVETRPQGMMGGFGMGIGGAAAQKPDQKTMDKFRRQSTRGTLYQLAGSGTLMKADKSGTTVLDRLDTISQQQTGPGIDRLELLSSATNSVAFPTMNGDGSDRTAVALQQSVLKDSPTDYLRNVSELASPEGRTELRPGVEVKREGDSSSASRIFQDATKSVASKELVQSELRSSDSRREAYDSLKPSQKKAFDTLLESQIPTGTVKFPTPEMNNDESTAALQKVNEQGYEAQQFGQTREKIYQMLDSGLKGDSVPELEAQLRTQYRETDYFVPHGDHSHARGSEKERNMTLPSNRERLRLVGEGLKSGETQRVRNSEGQEVDVRISTLSETDFKLQIDKSKPVRVRFHGSFSEEQKTNGVERLADYYSQIPEHLRGNAKTYVITDKSAAEYRNKPGNTAAATFTPLTKTIRFYDGLRSVNESIFNHEYGHATGYAIESRQDNIFETVFAGLDRFERGAPEGWKSAMRSDAGPVSKYATKNWREDFAESFTAYQEAREYGSDVVDSSITTRFPARAKILREVFTPPK